MEIKKKMTAVVPIMIFAALLLFLGVAEGQVTDEVEVNALRDIRKKLEDPMKNLRSWNRGDPCLSNWTGILCFNITQNDGNLHVEELHLLSLNLSGTLSPRVGDLSYLKILDVMWNKITGSLPKEIGKIKSLDLLLVNGNEFTGSLPDELGFLPNLRRIQIDQNDISGPIPKTFANLNKTNHFHMNNNSLSGQIPSELSVLPNLVHFLLDNNNLSGVLPPEFSRLPSLLIFQVDNNRFEGSIPASYGDMKKLLKLSVRNCNLQGPVPDLSRISNLAYIDLSRNQLNGSIPSNRLSNEMTTIDLSYNNLIGPIPANFSGLPRLQRLSLENNSLSGTVSSNIWQDRTFNATESILLDFQNNRLSNVSISVTPPANVSIRLQGNPICTSANQLNIVNFCSSQNDSGNAPGSPPAGPVACPPQSCPQDYEYVINAPVDCFCAAPLLVGYRLKSPGISDFPPYEDPFEVYLANGLEINLYQLLLYKVEWQEGPRLAMYLKLFPAFTNTSNTFDDREIRRLRSMFTGWLIPDSDIFGPYELLNFTLLGPYKNVILDFPKSKGVSKGAVAGIAVGAVAIAVTLSAIISILFMRRRAQEHNRVSRRRKSARASIKIDGVKDFTFGEMELATNNFNSSSQIGQGGYGKVYKGILADGTVVAVKRALEGSLQGYKEFFTEIELLSRVHHRNLVSLIGYCDEQGEQMLVYEYMPNGTLRDHLSVKTKAPMGFAMRLRLAIGSAKGILYLHTEADPPIFHRDIKASNILLDSKFIAKVADFGLSKLAPVPDMEGTTPGHISTVVKGTPGYLDPEYFLTHKLTDKSDVYSLGVVFLELLTGMHPISHGKNIVREVNLAYRSGMIFSLIDENMGSYPSECVQKFVTLALNCCQDDTDARPSMAEVVRQLENIRLMMPESDTGLAHSVDVEPKAHKVPPPSSSSSMNSPFVSADVSGSDLISGVMPSIAPR